MSIVLSGCSLFFQNIGPLQIEYSGVMVTLIWEDDSSELSTPSSVNHYDIFYRELGSINWIEIASTSNDSKVITINSNATGYGKYEFAVQTVYNNNKKSNLHTSTDFSAWPAGGWYINWEEGE